MTSTDKWFYCVRAMENIRELSSRENIGDADPFAVLNAEDRLEFINDLVNGTIDLIDFYDTSPAN